MSTTPPTAAGAQPTAAPTPSDLLRLVQDFNAFAGKWEGRAKDHEKLQCVAPSHLVIRELLAGLRGWIRDIGDAEVNLATAATLSGYSQRQLRRLIRNKQLKNHGSVGAPRIRLSNLPRK